MTAQLPLHVIKFKTGHDAATGAITVPNGGYRFYSEHKKLRGIYNPVELSSAYPLYKSTTANILSQQA